jgi:hypothetical protein
MGLYVTICFAIVSLKNTGPTILLALKTHQTPTFTLRSGTHGLDVDSVWTPVAIILRIFVSLQVKASFIRRECQLWIELTFDDRL